MKFILAIAIVCGGFYLSFVNPPGPAASATDSSQAVTEQQSGSSQDLAGNGIVTIKENSSYNSDINVPVTEGIQQSDIPQIILNHIAQFPADWITGKTGQLDAVIFSDNSGDNVLSSWAIWQPHNVGLKDGQVSPENVFTQFMLPGQYNVYGLEAHNYSLPGKSLFGLSENQIIYLVFGDRTIRKFRIYGFAQYQAVTPTSQYSDFTDLSTGTTYTHDKTFDREYTSDSLQLVLQTCIGKDLYKADGTTYYEGSWGRIFVKAEPVQ